MDQIKDFHSYMKHFLAAVGAKDEEKKKELKEYGKTAYISYHDIVEVMDEMQEYTDNQLDYSQALSEVRLKAIVSALPTDVRVSIFDMFNEVGDDLFKEEQDKEGEKNNE